VFDCTSFIQARYEELGASHLRRWRQADETGPSESSELLLVDHGFEKVFGHATIADLALLAEADLVIGIVAPDFSFSIG